LSWKTTCLDRMIQHNAPPLAEQPEMGRCYFLFGFFRNYRSLTDPGAGLPGNAFLSKWVLFYSDFPKRYSSCRFFLDLFCLPLAVKIPAFSTPQYSFMPGLSRTFREGICHIRCGTVQMGAAVQDQDFHAFLPSADRDRHVAAAEQFRHLLSALVRDMTEPGISPGV